MAVRVHLSNQVSDTLTDRILFYLEDNRFFRPGLWFGRERESGSFFLYLRAEQAPKQLTFLVSHYLVVWASFFDSSVASDTSDQSQLQTGQEA